MDVVVERSQSIVMSVGGLGKSVAAIVKINDESELPKSFRAK